MLNQLRLVGQLLAVGRALQGHHRQVSPADRMALEYLDLIMISWPA